MRRIIADQQGGAWRLRFTLTLSAQPSDTVAFQWGGIEHVGFGQMRSEFVDEPLAGGRVAVGQNDGAR